MTAPTQDNPEATAAEAAGPITVSETVGDDSLRNKLQKLLPRYPGVRAIEVEVDEGVVTLTGHVADAEVRDRLRDFVRRVQGVNLVLNRTKTDAQVLTAQDYALKQFQLYWDMVRRKWILFLVALGWFVVSLILAKLFHKHSDALLLPFTENILLRSVLGSVIAILIGIGGFLGALQFLGMTETVLSFLGLAGFVALAVGFAFRDIAENFIASIMLGLRRPFRVGDLIEVAGWSGVVKSLNTRATVLVTLDGTQVRIPNATIFKEVLVNKTASKTVRGHFDLVIPWDSSTATATEAITLALRAHQGFEKTPPPKTLVESIEPQGVRLRSYFWFPSKGVDRGRLLSEAQFAAKVALQKVGISPSTAPIVLRLPTEDAVVPVGVPGPVSPSPGPVPIAPQAKSNMEHDSEAAGIAAAKGSGEQENELNHALEIGEKGMVQEGTNLLGNEKPS